MVEAVKRHGRVCQAGLQRRSSAMCREMAEFVRGGGLGKVTGVRCFHIQNEWPKGIGNPPDSEPPAELRLGGLAGAGAEGALQPEPRLLPIPLVLRL